MATRKRSDKFPLWWHKGAKAWCKKIRGRFYYFGPDKDKALAAYVETAEAIREGREPRADVGTITVAELVNHFLTARRERVDSGELTPGMWAEYYRMSERVVDTLGRARAVADLRPADFARVRASAAKRLGPVALSKFVTMVRTLFGFAYKAELVDAPVRYGDQFDKPVRRVLRLERARKALKLIPAPDVWKLISRADAQLRAMIFLGLNCGFGQTDCANLTRQALGLRPGWVDFPRRKSGVGRRAPLWPETLDALAAVGPIRPDPKDPGDGDLVFVTIQGNQWVCYREPAAEGMRGHSLDAVARSFRRVSIAAGVDVAGGFYTLRHVFRTVADETKDRPAIDLIMGHADHSMASYYREHIADDRLRAVTDHVRAWLLAGKPARQV